jgi:hypothetical protein
MMMPKITILALGLVLVVAFQNCGNDMRFEQEGSLVAKADEDTDGDGIPDDPSNDDSGDDDGSSGGGGVNPGDGQPPRTSPTPSPTPGYGGGGGGMMPRPPSSGGGGKDCKDRDKDCEECRNRGEPNEGSDSRDDTSQSNYLCVLEGPGKSVKLNYVSGPGAFADESASDAACMSKHACLNIASKAFRVKLAEQRGFCQNSSRSGRVRLSDKQVEEAASKAKLLQLVHSK